MYRHDPTHRLRSRQSRARSIFVAQTCATRAGTSRWSHRGTANGQTLARAAMGGRHAELSFQGLASTGRTYRCLQPTNQQFEVQFALVTGIFVKRHLLPPTAPAKSIPICFLAAYENPICFF